MCGICGIFAWQTGLGYLVLWGMAYWTLAHGAAVFGGSGVCHADSAQVLFYWACEPASPLAILAGAANFALTATVWAPVFVAAPPVRAPPSDMVCTPLAIVPEEPPPAAGGINAGARCPVLDLIMMSPNCSGCANRPSVS